MNMNDDPRFSLCTVIAGVAWVSTGVLLMIAWVAWIVDAETHLAILLAETACVVSAVAAVAQTRCMAARVCRLIRVTSGVSRPEGEVHDFSGRRR